MLHKDSLKLLFPIELQGDFEKDIELEGKHLDDAQLRAEHLLNEMFPDQSYELLPDWERVCGLTPGNDDTLQLRRDRVIRKLRERGGLSIPYFIALAEAMGYTITIEELKPFMAGINRAGDALYIYESIWIWRVKVFGKPLYYFRAGRSVAGERLLWWSAQTELEDLLKELKPAHTYVIFEYNP
jgi:uncharacterized protein YmfQ (DUF2313 family)